MCSCSKMRAASVCSSSPSSTGDRFLHNDRPVVEFFVHEMHGAAGDFHAIGEGLLLRFEARKRGQQRRMDVQNPPRKLLHEPRRQQPHVSGQADQVYVFLFQSGDDFAVMLLARLALRRNHDCFQSALDGQSRSPARRICWQSPPRFAYPQCGPHQCSPQWRRS